MSENMDEDVNITNNVPMTEIITESAKETITNSEMESMEETKTEPADEPMINSKTEPAAIIDFNENNKNNKKMIIGILAVFVAVAAVGIVFAKSGLFKSNMERIIDATKNTVYNYFYGDEDAFLSKIFNSDALQKTFTDSEYDPSITISGTFNGSSSRLNGVGLEATLDIDKSDKEVNLSGKGVYKGIELDGFMVYANDEYAILESPYIDDKFYVNMEDLVSNGIIGDIEEFKNRQDILNESSEKIADMASDMWDDIIFVINKNVEAEKLEGETIENIDCDVYKISLNNEDIINLFQNITDEMLENGNYQDTIKEVMQDINPDIDVNEIGIDSAVISRQVAKELENIDINGIDMTFYINGGELVRAEFDLQITDGRGYAVEASFTGENKLTDNVDVEIYYYRNDKYKDGLSFTDFTEKNGSEVKNTKTLAVKKNKDEEVIGEYAFVTNYDSSSYEFDGYIEDTNNNISMIEFSGTLESNSDMIDLKVDEFSIMGKDDTSFGVKISEIESIDVIDKDGAIDVINERKEALKALEEVTKNLPFDIDDLI